MTTIRNRKIERELDRISNYLKSEIANNENHILEARRLLAQFDALSDRIGDTMGSMVDSRAEDMKGSETIANCL